MAYGFLEPETVIDYIEQADRLLVSFGATTERFMPNNDLKAECLKYDLHMSQAQLKHLGTDENFDTMRKMIEHISEKMRYLYRRRRDRCRRGGALFCTDEIRKHGIPG